MDQLDWKEYRRPLLKQPWYPVVNTPELDSTLIKKLLGRFGDPLKKVSLISKDNVFHESKTASWRSAIDFGKKGLSSIFTERFEVSTSYYLVELTDAHVLLPFGIIWSERDNEYYSEPYIASNARSSYLFLQSHYTDWKVLRSKWMPEPVIVDEPVYWAYDSQYTNIFHYIHDNYWKIVKYEDFSSNKAIPPQMNFFSAPTKGSNYVDYLLDGARLSGNLHLYFGHGHFVFRKLFVPLVKNNFPSGVDTSDGYRHRCFDDFYYSKLVKGLSPHSQTTTGRGLKLMLLREDAAHRNIKNINEVKDILERYGFETYNPGHESMRDQIDTFSRASHIVAVHGASLANLVWCRPNLRFLELMPLEHQNAGYRGITASKGIDHFVMLSHMSGEASSMSKPPAYQDIIVNVDSLIDFLDMYSF